MDTIKETEWEKRSELFYAPYTQNYLWNLTPNEKHMSFEEDKETDEANQSLWEHVTNLILSKQDLEFRKKMRKLEKDKQRRIRLSEDSRTIVNQPVAVNTDST